MSEPIKVGDLVMAVRGHSCVVAKIGGVQFIVKAIIRQHGGGWFCPVCATPDHGKGEFFAASLEGLHTDAMSGIPLGWLKRIPPFPELADEKHEEDLLEPA